jgi:uncharacterized membrane protein YqaE (UPF0057 family)
MLFLRVAASSNQISKHRANIKQTEAPRQPNEIDRKNTMRLLLAILLPWLQFFTIGRPIAGIICLILQITVIGWLPAAIWSVYPLSQYKTDEKIKEALSQRR